LDQPAKRSPTGLAAAGFASALISIPFKEHALIVGGAIFAVAFSHFGASDGLDFTLAQFFYRRRRGRFHRSAGGNVAIWPRGHAE